MFAETSVLAETDPPTLADVDELKRRRVLEVLPRAMKSRGVDLFLVFTRQNAPDPIAGDVGLGRVVARACGVFHLDAAGSFRRTAVVASLDVPAVEESGIYETVLPYKEQMRPLLAKTVLAVGGRRIAVNISRDLTVADGLTAGMRDYLESVLGPDVASRFVSSEGVILALLGSKFPEEISAIEDAAIEAQTILAKLLTVRGVDPGSTTEQDLAGAIRRESAARRCEPLAVSVMVGPARGRSSPTPRTIRRGELLRTGLGLSRGGYCCDIKRTAYVLRESETEAPAEIRKMFEVTVAAHEAALAAMRPGVAGLAVDTAARRVIEAAGFKGYPHAAGHGLGRRLRDVAPLLGPDWPERYGSLVRSTLEAGQVFAIEPAVYGPSARQDGEVNVAVQDDAVVETQGARVLGEAQRELILIR